MQTTTGNALSIIVIADHLAFFSIDRHNVAYDTRYQPKVNALGPGGRTHSPASTLCREPPALPGPFAYHRKGMTLYFTRVLYSR